MHYRLSAPTMVLAFRDNHQAAVAVQPDQIINVIGPAEDDRFLVVAVEDQQFLMFGSDLDDRGRPVGMPPAEVPAKRDQSKGRRGEKLRAK